MFNGDTIFNHGGNMMFSDDNYEIDKLASCVEFSYFNVSMQRNLGLVHVDN